MYPQTDPSTLELVLPPQRVSGNPKTDPGTLRWALAPREGTGHPKKPWHSKMGPGTPEGTVAPQKWDESWDTKTVPGSPGWAQTP